MRQSPVFAIPGRESLFASSTREPSLSVWYETLCTDRVSFRSYRLSNALNATPAVFTSPSTRDRVTTSPKRPLTPHFSSCPSPPARRRAAPPAIMYLSAADPAGATGATKSPLARRSSPRLSTSATSPRAPPKPRLRASCAPCQSANATSTGAATTGRCTLSRYALHSDS